LYKLSTDSDEIPVNVISENQTETNETTLVGDSENQTETNDS